MLLGLYGGTFNPVHRGHVHAALAVCRELQLREVRMILAARPGHRNDPAVTAHDRWRMLELACAQHAQLVADDLELQRPGESYTVRTLEDIHRQHEGAIACWILGQDSFATLSSWFEWRRLLDLANLVVLDRPGQPAPEPRAVVDLCGEHEVATLQPERHGQIVRLQLPMLEISSTAIRAGVARGEDVGDLLAGPVYTYIRDHNLYQNSEKAI